MERYLRERVTLLHIHRFDPGDVQFADALVSSAVVWFRNSPPRLVTTPSVMSFSSHFSKPITPIRRWSPILALLKPR